MNMSDYSDEEIDELAGPEDDEPEQESYDVTQDMSGFERFLAGMGRGFHNIGRSALGYTPESWGVQDYLGNDAEMDRLDQALLNTGAGAAGNFASELAATAPVGGAAASMLGRGVSALPQAARFVNPYTAGAGRGAVEGGVASAMVGGDPLEGATVGGAIGGSIPLVGRAWRGMARPARPSREALEIERLGRDQGVDIGMTAGQLADDVNFTGGLIKGLENTIDRIPGAGALRHAKQEAVANWNQAEIKNAMPDWLSDRVTASGAEGMGQARQAINDGYDAALSAWDDTRLMPSDVLDARIAGIEDAASNRLTGASLDDAVKQIDNLSDDMRNGRINPDNVKTVETAMRKRRDNARRSGNISEGDVYNDLLTLVRENRDLAVGNTASQQLQDLDAAYRSMAPIRDAAAMKGAMMEDFFTPSQLMSGANKGDTQWNKASRGSPMADRAFDAHKVFGSTIPEVGPGTAEKIAAQSMLGGVAGVAGDLASGGSGGLLQSGLLGAVAAPVMGQAMPFMRNPLMGRTAGQQWMRRQQRPLESLLGQINPWAVRSGVLGYED